MCGLAGFFNLNRLPSHAERTCARMISRLAHRGPDGARVLVDEAANIAMGHARLAINDLSSTGLQPMRSADGRITIAVNGEIYGFKALRATLASEGEQFISRSDSETLFGMYKRHDVAFCEHIRGEFAVVLYDLQCDRLVLTRDRFGVRPLYYYFDEEQLVWASEVKALLAHPAIPRRLSPRAAVNQLVQVMVPGSSAFDRVKAVRPGSQVVVERSGGRLRLSDRRYWDIRFNVGDDGALTTEAHVEAVRSAVVDAVIVRTETDAPLGVYLSGGLDSGVALGVAAAALQRAPTAVTLSFAHEDYDELATARDVARWFGAPLEVRSVTHEDLYGEHFVRALWHSERTFYNTLGVAKMQLSRFARQHGLRAVLTGEGADELFGGYPAFVIDAEGSLPGCGPHLDDVLAGSVVALDQVRHAAVDRLWGFTPAWIQPWVAVWRRIKPLLREGLLAEEGDYDPIAAVAHSVDAARVPHGCRLSVAQYTWINVMLEGQILNWGGDRVDMAHAVESRPVFLDHLLAETAARVPAPLRVKHGTEKWILRTAMKGLLPPSLRDKRKFPLLAPPAYRAPAALDARAELVASYLSPGRIERLGICDPRGVVAFLKQTESPSSMRVANEDDKIVNHLLGLHILEDLFVQQNIEGPP
jgi:asparagine synthase (glutamine-hydrolysing)